MKKITATLLLLTVSLFSFGQTSRAEVMYDSLTNVIASQMRLINLRDNSVISNPFYYEDGENLTYVLHHNERIETITWRTPYRFPGPIPITIEYGQTESYELLRAENILFAGFQGRYKKFNLEEIGIKYYISGIWTNQMDNTVIIAGYDFYRQGNPEKYYIILDLSTGISIRVPVSYWYKTY